MNEEILDHSQLGSNKWYGLVALILILAAAATFFSRGYSFLPGDDAAASIVAGRYLAQEGNSDFISPYNPVGQTEFYTNYIAPEFPLHTVLAQLYLLTGVSDILRTTNIFVVGIFVLGGLILYLLILELTQSPVLSALGVGIGLFSYWHGFSFWAGHYAQLLGYLPLLSIMYALVRFERRNEWRWLTFAGLMTIALFPIHSLSFLVVITVFLGYAVTRFLVFPRVRKEFHAVGLLLLLFWIFTFTMSVLNSRSGGFLFETESYQAANLHGTLVAMFDSTVVVLFLLMGVFWLLQQRKPLLIIWFLVPYLLINSGILRIPFYPYRFNEFIAIPLVLIAMVGLRQLLGLLQSKILTTALVLWLLVVYPPFLIQNQLQLRSCYLAYCEGLNPASLIQEDYDAMLWVRDHTAAKDIFVAPSKFGLFIPAVAGRSVAFPVLVNGSPNEAYKILTATSPEERWRAAKDINAQYVFWDAVFDRYGATYKPYKIFSEQFNDPRYFVKVYDKNFARIYQVIR